MTPRPSLLRGLSLLAVLGGCGDGGPDSPASPEAAVVRHYATLMSASYQAQNPSWPTDRSAADPGINVISVGVPRYSAGRAQVSVDFYARDMHTGRRHGLNGLGHVLLSECGARVCIPKDRRYCAN